MSNPKPQAFCDGKRWAETAPIDQLLRLHKLFHSNVDNWDNYFAIDKNAFTRFIVDVVDPVQSELNPHPALKFWATHSPNANPTAEFVQAFADGALSADRAGA
jgi:hypothetical protein